MGADSQENRIQTGSVVQLFDCSQTLAAVCVCVCVREKQRREVCVFDTRAICMFVCAGDTIIITIDSNSALES